MPRARQCCRRISPANAPHRQPAPCRQPASFPREPRGRIDPTMCTSSISVDKYCKYITVHHCTVRTVQRAKRARDGTTAASYTGPAKITAHPPLIEPTAGGAGELPSGTMGTGDRGSWMCGWWGQAPTVPWAAGDDVPIFLGGCGLGRRAWPCVKPMTPSPPFPPWEPGLPPSDKT